MQFLKISFLVILSKCTFAQNIYYSNEAKYIDEKTITKWNSRIEISIDGYTKCDTLNKGNDCKNSAISYKYSLINDTIFIFYKNKDGITSKSPQYSLNRRDTISFLRQDESGFSYGATCGEIVFIKDTVLVINKKNYPCYLFEKNQRRRDNAKKIGYIERERIYLDKKSLIPLFVSTKYWNPFKLKNYKGAYKTSKAIL